MPYSNGFIIQLYKKVHSDIVALCYETSPPFPFPETVTVLNLAG